MFCPNLIGSIKDKVGRDVHGRHILGGSRPCPFGPVSLNIGAIKTSVRADSSASRGSADQIAVERGVILIPHYIEVDRGDIFSFQDVDFEIVAIHTRFAVDGFLDHFQCELEVHLG